jgi:hypothetical protein
MIIEIQNQIDIKVESLKSDIDDKRDILFKKLNDIKEELKM